MTVAISEKILGLSYLQTTQHNILTVNLLVCRLHVQGLRGHIHFHCRFQDRIHEMCTHTQDSYKMLNNLSFFQYFSYELCQLRYLHTEKCQCLACYNFFTVFYRNRLLQVCYIRSGTGVYHNSATAFYYNRLLQSAFAVVLITW